ncbi:MAG: SRPBCC family protein [Leptospiraceae bacterium]|nr:SRPBCC family protein [Leptospiraceae bacterium]
MIKKILIVLGICILIFLGYVTTKPNSYRVERKIEIKTSPEKVFDSVNNLKNWALWSPWDKLDPDMKRIYSGPESGKGAIYEWKGNKDVGSGRMEISESDSPKKIIFQIQFLEPFEDKSITEFLFNENGEFITVTWAMNGNYNFMSKVMCTFISMDNMIGKDFETGLKNLKALLEAK